MAVRHPSPSGCTAPTPLPPAVLDARLSRMGVPLVTLSNSRAYVWSADLEGWACVADESFAGSQFMPVLSLAGQGEHLGGGGVYIGLGLHWPAAAGSF